MYSQVHCIQHKPNVVSRLVVISTIIHCTSQKYLCCHEWMNEWMMFLLTCDKKLTTSALLVYCGKTACSHSSKAHLWFNFVTDVLRGTSNGRVPVSYLSPRWWRTCRAWIPNGALNWRLSVGRVYRTAIGLFCQEHFSVERLTEQN